MKKTLVKLTAFILATCMCIGTIPTMANEANPESNPDEMLMLSEDVVEPEEESATAAVPEEIVTEELVQDPSEEVVSTEELEITEPVLEETVPEAVVQKETAVIEPATGTTVEEVTTEKATAEEETEQDDDLEQYFFADTVGDGYITVNPGEPVTMAVKVDASDTNIQYEWYVMGVDNEWQLIEGINGNTYTISNTIKVAGNYLCEVSDSHGNSKQLNFNVEVENHFSIEENAPIYALAGTNVTMSVGVSGDNLADMTYQWIVLGADEEEIIIEGANTAVYEAAPITNQWATYYACKVQDCYGNMGYTFFEIILINDLQELSLDEVVSVTQTIPYSIIAYKYVPAVTGNYQIQLFESNIYCTICDENWNDLASNYQELSYDLQAGKTYYFKVQIDEGSEATGTVEAKLTMLEEHQIEISSATVSGISNKTYNGNAQTQTFSISVNDAVLTEGTDYTVSYTNNVNAGTATVTITGIGQYIGTLTKTFTINAKTVTPTVRLAATTYTYDGTAKQPLVTVKDGSTTLAAKDYTVAYSNNVNVGTSTAKVTLKGNYRGSATASYSIKAKAITPTVTLSKTSFVYNGKVQKPAVTVKDGTGTLPASVYDITYSGTCKTVGTYKVTVTLKGNYSGSATASYSIKAKAVTPTVTLSKINFVYTGKVQKPAVTVKDGTGTLPASVYDITYSGTCKNAGAYKVTVTLKGNYSGKDSKNFSIVKALNPMTVKTESKTVKLATVKKKAVTVKAITASRAQGTVRYKKANGKSYFTVNKKTGKIKVKKGTPKGTYNVKVRVTATGNNNYKGLIITKSVTIVVK